MAAGAQAKQEVTQKILETFEGSFVYDKEIRVPIMEDGVLRQIKVTLTCAKVNVSEGGDTAMPGTAAAPKSAGINFEEMTPEQPIAQAIAPTAEEKENIAALLASLGL